MGATQRREAQSTTTDRARRGATGAPARARGGRRRWTAVAVVTGAVLLAGACSSSGGTAQESTTTSALGAALGGFLPTADLESVEESVERTSTTDRGRLHVQLTIAGTGMIDGELLQADGAFVLSDDLAELEITPGRIGKAGGLEPSRGVAHGSDIYVQDEAAAALLGVTTPWMRYLDPCGDDGLGQGFVPFGGADALTLLDVAGSSGSAVTEVGEEKVAGFPAVHFRTEVDLGAAVKAFSQDCAGDWAAFEGSSVPLDLWIHTTSGVVMREVLTFDLEDFLERTDPETAAEVAGLGGTLEYRVEFYDLGSEDIAISVPGDDEVTEVTKQEYEAAGEGESATADKVSTGDDDPTGAQRTTTTTTAPRTPRTTASDWGD